MTSRFLTTLVLAFALFILSATSVSAASYFVNTSASNASNSNNGSQSSPWKTIQYAVTNPLIQPGDTINVMPGTYTESVRVNGLSGGRCGANGNYITLRGYDPNNKPVLNGTSTDYRARVKIENCSYYKVENFNFNTFYNGGLHFYNSFPSGGTMSHLVARNNNFENQSATAVTGITDWVSTLLVMGGHYDNYAITDVEISDNTFNRVQPGIPSSYNEVLAIEGNVRKVKIENNVLRNIYFLGIALKGQEGPSCAGCPYVIWQAEDIVVRGNTIDSGTKSNWGLGGIYIEGANRVLMEDNVVKNIPAPIQISDEPYRVTTLDFDRYIVRGNVTDASETFGIKIGHGSCAPGYYPVGFTAYDTVYNAAVSNNIFGGSTAGAGTVVFSKVKDVGLKNNIYLSQTANTIYHVEYAPYNDGWELDGNLMCTNSQKFNTLNTDPNVNGCEIVRYNSLQSLTNSTGFDRNSRLACPTFQSGTYNLQSNSPGFEQGIPLTTTTTAGTNTSSIPVRDAKYFYDGWGIEGEVGDRIKVGGVATRVTSVNYATSTLTVNPAVSFSSGAPVNYHYEGSNPSMGLLPESFYDKGGLENTPTPQSSTPTSAPSCPSFSQGNATCDSQGAIDLTDFTCWKGEFLTGTAPQGCPGGADFDTSGSVDILDFAIWQVTYGSR